MWTRTNGRPEDKQRTAEIEAAKAKTASELSPNEDKLFKIRGRVLRTRRAASPSGSVFHLAIRIEDGGGKFERGAVEYFAASGRAGLAKENDTVSFNVSSIPAYANDLRDFRIDFPILGI